MRLPWSAVGGQFWNPSSFPWRKSMRPYTFIAIFRRAVLPGVSKKKSGSGVTKGECARGGFGVAEIRCLMPLNNPFNCHALCYTFSSFRGLCIKS